MFSKLAFWKNYGQGKLAKAGDVVLQTMVELDPEGMSKAEISAEREKFEKFCLEVEDYRAAYTREAAEADAARKAYNTKMDQIKALDAAAEQNPDKAEKYLSAGNKLREEAAELLGSARQEIEEAEQAKADLDEVEAIQKEMAATVKMLEQSLDKARAEMARAKRAEDRADKRAQHQERMKGLRSGAGTGVASAAMVQKTKEAKKRTLAANRRTELLSDAKDSVDKVFVDDDVAAVLATASRADTTSSMSLPDSL